MLLQLQVLKDFETREINPQYLVSIYNKSDMNTAANIAAHIAQATFPDPSENVTVATSSAEVVVVLSWKMENHYVSKAIQKLHQIFR